MSERVKPKRRRGYTRVSPKHQVTIPVDALREGGVRVGDQLKVDVHGRSIVLTPVTDLNTSPTMCEVVPTPPDPNVS